MLLNLINFYKKYLQNLKYNDGKKGVYSLLSLVGIPSLLILFSIKNQNRGGEGVLFNRQNLLS